MLKKGLLKLKRVEELKSSTKKKRRDKIVIKTNEPQEQSSLKSRVKFKMFQTLLSKISQSLQGV
jgi:hypothetical protein